MAAKLISLHFSRLNPEVEPIWKLQKVIENIENHRQQGSIHHLDLNRSPTCV
jgi:hypothetical protein